MGLGGNIYSNAQIRQHQFAERIYHSREAQAIMGSYYANEDGDAGSDSIWHFGRGLSGNTTIRLEQNVLSKVSFLIPATGSAWPWIAGIGLILAMIQALASCIARVYLVYRARGIGVWLIPTALGMAFTLLAIPWTALRPIWRDLKQDQTLDISQETPLEREQALRGPGPGIKKTRLYPGISWADEADFDMDLEAELPNKKTVIGILLKDVSQPICSLAPQINSPSGSGQAPSRGCEAD